MGGIASDDYDHCMKIIKKAFVDHGLDKAFNDPQIYCPLNYWEEKIVQPNSAASPHNIVWFCNTRDSISKQLLPHHHDPATCWITRFSSLLENSKTSELRRLQRRSLRLFWQMHVVDEFSRQIPHMHIKSNTCQLPRYLGGGGRWRNRWLEIVSLLFGPT